MWCLCVRLCARDLSCTAGRILVPGIYDLVAPMTAGELSTYDPIDFDPVEYAGAIGTPGKLLHSTKCVALRGACVLLSLLLPPPLSQLQAPVGVVGPPACWQLLWLLTLALVCALLWWGRSELLQHRWRYPTLSLHGIEGAFSGPGQKTVIPGACPAG